MSIYNCFNVAIYITIPGPNLFGSCCMLSPSIMGKVTIKHISCPLREKRSKGKHIASVNSLMSSEKL